MYFVSSLPNTANSFVRKIFTKLWILATTRNAERRDSKIKLINKSNNYINNEVITLCTDKKISRLFLILCVARDSIQYGYRAVWLSGFCSLWMIAPLNAKLVTLLAAFLFSLPVSAIPNTYLMHHTCAPILILVSTWGVHFRHTGCKIGGESYRATPAISKCNRGLSLICYIQETSSCRIVAHYSNLIVY